MQLRTTYKGFTEAVDAYFDRLMPIVVPLQASTAIAPLYTDECRAVSQQQVKAVTNLPASLGQPLFAVVAHVSSAVGDVWLCWEGCADVCIFSVSQHCCGSAPSD